VVYFGSNAEFVMPYFLKKVIFSVAYLWFSILDAISSGLNTQSQIEAFMGEKSIGGQEM